ncbi:hypothetical protein HELRODRAFT_70799 [Helobdella robusta]|uniref:GOLD domain-containing protein n=1 Tax=Helobdella robusta TaxID=6412 RepID=T1G0C3_HELRO|nr:hypothetical protein HELRODRAFT_70799 [Helobdella robusta]ESN90466.1 hypothetical protein HELRODRAFT_70799 [Helobdella robusta]
MIFNPIKSFVCFFLPAIHGLYFHIGETQKKCFIEDIPDDTLVVGKYKVEIFDANISRFVPSLPGLGMHVEVKDVEDKTMLSRTYASEGRFSFTSHMAGEHLICLHANTSAWFGGHQLRIHLSIQVGERANDYQEIASKDKLTELQLRVRQLLDQIEMISKEQNYQRFREERFRETSESTNQRVFWWAVAQLSILVVTGFWQMKHLKGFFEAKKLV